MTARFEGRWPWSPAAITAPSAVALGPTSPRSGAGVGPLRSEGTAALAAVREAGNTVLKRFGLSLAIGALSLSAQAQVFQAASGGLSLERHQELQADPLAVPDRWRVARFDRSEVARASDSDTPLVLNLFNDVEVRGRVKATKDLGGGASFTSGSLEGGGHFSIFVHGSGIVRGEVHSSEGVYAMRSEGEDFNQVLIRQQDVSELPGCGNEALPAGGEVPAGAWRPLGPAAGAGAGGWSRQARQAPAPADDEASEAIDILVLYTQRVEDHEGGPEQVKATIENEMAKMNQILDNSGLSHRQVRLAMEKVDYEQTENIGLDLSNLDLTEEDHQYRNDGRDYSALDEVQSSLMEEHQADLVHLFVLEGRGACGQATSYWYNHEYRVQRDCENADDNESCVEHTRRKYWRDLIRGIFSISSIICSTNGPTFAHEIGHNLGLRHNREDYVFREGGFERSGPFKNYAFGYIDPNGRENCSKNAQSTVMSSVVLSCGNSYQTFPRPYFSNPDLFFPPPHADYPYPYRPNTPMGVPGDERTTDLDGPVDASRAIDEVWDIVASLSDLPEEERAVCNEGDVAADALSSLPDAAAFPARGGTRRFDVSFPAPENCSRVSLQASSSLAAVSASAEKLRLGSHRLSIAAAPHDGACGSGPRTAEVTVSLVETALDGTMAGVPGVAPATISVEQGFDNALCGGVSGASEEAVSLDLSGRNPYSGFRLSSGMFAGFTRLEDLDLSDNLLGHFQNSHFDGLNLLESLDLSGNELAELEDAALAHLPKLEHLNLRGNKLRRMKDSYFDKPFDADNRDATYYPLKTLDLSHNELRELDPRWIGDLRHLESLQLNDNQLEALDWESFYGADELKQLNLAHNSIEAVGDAVFAYTPKLTHLNLSSNRISGLLDETFGRVYHDGTVNALEDLRQLNLSRNRLEEFPELSMNGKLTHLWLGWNRIASVGDGLSEQAELTGLQLSSNRLAEFPDLSNNGKLTRLWLGGNAIAAVGDGLSNLTELTALQLSRNQLEEMPDLSNNGKLTHLWLEGNKVASVPPRAFAGLSELQYLNISDNPLTEPLPRAVCTFIRGVKTVVAKGIDMGVVCPE